MIKSQINSRYLLRQIAAVSIVLFLGLAIAGFLFLLLSTSELTQSKKTIYFIFLFGLCAAFTVASLQPYFRYCKPIVLDQDVFWIGKKQYCWADCKKFRLFSSEVGFLSMKNKECSVVHLPDSSKYLLYESHYSNSGELRLFFDAKLNSEPSTAIEGQVVDAEKGVFAPTAAVFKGPVFLSLRLLFLLGLMVFFGLMFFKSPSLPLFWIFGTAVFISIRFMLRFSYYVELSSSELIVRNHFLPSYNKRFNLQTIRQVAFLDEYKRPTILRVIDQNLHSRSFYAQSLRNSDWRNLRTVLRAVGIPVRVEVYIGK